MQTANGAGKNGFLYCPVKATIGLLEHKWTLAIVLELLTGKKRFNELAAAVGGVNSRTLRLRLRALEEGGLVRRRVVSQMPPWVEYELTGKGRSLTVVVKSIAAWGRRWMNRHTVGRVHERPLLRLGADRR